MGQPILLTMEKCLDCVETTWAIQVMTTSHKELLQQELTLKLATAGLLMLLNVFKRQEFYFVHITIDIIIFHICIYATMDMPPQDETSYKMDNSSEMNFSVDSVVNKINSIELFVL